MKAEKNLNTFHVKSVKGYLTKSNGSYAVSKFCIPAAFRELKEAEKWAAKINGVVITASNSGYRFR
tara:strand:- start:7321 stop:7518 length:198 start_codon:yes stop_codon:yes gene_type:complete